jgi:YHYH protein
MIHYWKRSSLIGLLLVCAVLAVWAQAPPLRRHHAIGKRPLDLLPASEEPPSTNRVSVNVDDGNRHVVANGIPDHKVGRFPNRANPNKVQAQQYSINLPAKPKPAEKITSIYLEGRRGPPNMPFGVTVTGVLMDPGTAEFWNGDRRSGWNYEALGGAIPLGLDENMAHVQPNGSYHYHGLPHQLLKSLGFKPGKHSPQVAWAADGFPIYAVYGYKEPKNSNSAIVELKTSFRLKQGTRPDGEAGPGGKYDGTFVQDYEFVDGAGDLDECNGRFCVTPEFPNGTYAYFLTRDWPVIPRLFRGTPVSLR